PGLFGRLNQYILRHPGTILAGSAALVIGSVLLIPHIRKDVDWSLCLAKGSDPYVAEMILRNEYGGSLPAQILYHGDLQDPQVLQQIFLTENYLEFLGKIDQPLSIAGVIAEMNYVMTGKYMIPKTRAEVSNLWFLLEGQDLLPQLVSNNNRDALLQGKVASMDTRILVDAVNRVDTYLHDTAGRYRTPEAQALALIFWNAREYGAVVDTGKIRAVIDGYRTDTDVLKRQLGHNIRQHLLSANSEVPFDEESGADSLATALTQFAVSGSFDLSTGQIETFLRKPAFRLTADDAFFLAPSLEKLIHETRGALRNRRILAGLAPMLPDSVRDNPDFQKEVTGALWLLESSPSADSMAAAPAMLAATHTGLPPILKQMEEELTPTQVESVLLALVLIVLLFALIFRSVKTGILGVVPLVLTIMLNFAVMALLHIGLDSFTAMIASLTIGLGVDYAVHFTSRFRRESESTPSMSVALQRTMETTGRAIMINAFAVGTGFVVLLLAGGQHLRRFGGLTSFTMMTAAVLTLVVLPSVYLLVSPKSLTPQASDQPSGEAPPFHPKVSEV
ncbi:MAG TPA: MMPL family transporter, partial [bacterium]|nr:MMPL family transporter [bacterium]